MTMSNDTRQPLKIGVVGIGSMGSFHAKQIYSGKINNLSLTAVCDIEPSKLEWARKHLKNVKHFSNYKEMIDSGLVDSILIVTPHYLHPEIAI